MFGLVVCVCVCVCVIGSQYSCGYAIVTCYLWSVLNS